MISATPMGPGWFIFFQNVTQDGGTSSPGKRQKIYKTGEVYEILRQAREKVEEPGISKKELVARENQLLDAEKHVAERLSKRYSEISAKQVSEQVLSGFVSAVTFTEEMQDIEQVFLILLIDELTDG